MNTSSFSNVSSFSSKDNLNISKYQWPTINIAQILLDWINTIKEPHCLLASNLSNLKDGMVFIEFLKRYLIEQGIPKEEINISSQLTKEEKLKLLLYSIIALTNGEFKAKAQKFYKINEEIYSNDIIMIKFLLFLKELYESNIFTPTESFYSNEKDISINEIIIESKVNKNTMNNNPIENTATSVIYHSTGNDKKFFTSLQDNTPEEIILKDKEERDNTSVNNLNFEVNTSQNNAQKDKQLEKGLNVFKFNLSPKSNNDINNFGYSLSPTKSATFSISPTNNINHSCHSFYLHKQNKGSSGSKINKRMKAQIHLMTGIYSLSTNKNPKIDKFTSIGNINQPLPLVIFYRPTNPIIEINLTSIKKMSPILLKDEPQILKKGINQKYIPLKLNPNKKNEYSIKKWLISLSLISQKSMNVSIVKLLQNGVLLCDILNHFEGKNKVIQGIIRNPYTKSQMKSNLIKACEYIRGMNGVYPYINNISTNCEEEIIKENEFVTYTLIDSLFKYYNNKTSLKSQRSISPSTKNIPSIDLLTARNFNKKTSDKYIFDFYDMQSVSSRKNQTINPFKLQKHKKQFSSNGNIFDSSTFLLNGSSSFNSDKHFQQFLSQNINSLQPLTQISDISGIPKQKQFSPSVSNSSIIISPSNNNSSLANWQEIESEVNTHIRLSKSKIQNDKKKDQRNKANLNCMILFRKENLDMMKREIHNKEKQCKTKEIKFD